MSRFGRSKIHEVVFPITEYLQDTICSIFSKDCEILRCGFVTGECFATIGKHEDLAYRCGVVSCRLYDWGRLTRISYRRVSELSEVCLC